MYTTKLVICLLAVGAASKCLSATDTRGPYKTEAECMDRGAEMVVGVNGMLKTRGFVGTSKMKIVCDNAVKGTRI